MAAVASIAAVWWPFLSSNDTDLVFRYWDGPSYVTVAYSLYSKGGEVYSAYGFGADFYSAHFPAYPLAIRLFSAIGYFNSMLLVTVLATIAASLAFYFLARESCPPKGALLLSIVFLLFPPRWVIYHSVGASEPLFLFSVISSVFFLGRKNVFFSAAFGVLAALTRTTGVLLFPALVAAAVHGKYFNGKASETKETRIPAAVIKEFAALLLIPAAFLLLLAFFNLQFGSFLAPFKINAGYIKGPLSAVVEHGGAQAGEFTALLFGAYLLGLARLWQRERVLFFFASAAFVLPFIFVSHNDLSRYLLPAFPFALLLAFDDVLAPMLERKGFWLAFAVLVAATYAYAWNAIPNNLMPADAFARLREALTK